MKDLRWSERDVGRIGICVGPERPGANLKCESCGDVQGCYMTTALSCPLARLPRLTNLTKHPGTSACPPPPKGGNRRVAQSSLLWATLNMEVAYALGNP